MDLIDEKRIYNGLTAREAGDNVIQGPFLHKLHAARYAYHKQIKHKYMVLSVLPPEDGAEMYRRSMLNYDRLIEDAAGGSLTEADEADMAKGFAP